MSPAPLLDTDRVKPYPRTESQISAMTKSHRRWRRWEKKRRRRECGLCAHARAASKRGDAIGTWRERRSTTSHRNRRGRNVSTKKIRTRIKATQAASRRTLLAQVRSLDGKADPKIWRRCRVAGVTPAYCTYYVPGCCCHHSRDIISWQAPTCHLPLPVCSTRTCKLLCPHWEIKSKGFHPRNRLSFRLRQTYWILWDPGTTPQSWTRPKLENHISGS